MSKEYYNKNAQDFIDNTINADMSQQYQMFEDYQPTNAKILDIGFGSGRDSLYFSTKYDVTSIDVSEEFIRRGKELLNNKVELLDVKDMDYKNEFNGIWACASLLHIPSKELNNVFIRCSEALSDNGIMYVSFKHGEYEGMRNGRFFTDLTEDSLSDLLQGTNLKVKEILLTEDVRPDRDEKWLNAILIK